MEEMAESSKTIYKPLLHKKKLTIKKLPQVPHYNMSLSLEKKIKTLFFVKQGTSMVDVTFERDTYNPNEIAYVKVNVNNLQCEKDIEKIKI